MKQYYYCFLFPENPPLLQNTRKDSSLRVNWTQIYLHELLSSSST